METKIQTFDDGVLFIRIKFNSKEKEQLKNNEGIRCQFNLDQDSLKFKDEEDEFPSKPTKRIMKEIRKIQERSFWDKFFD